MILSYQGTTPKPRETVFAAEVAQIIGEVTIGKDPSIWCNAVIYGDVNSIDSGEITNLQASGVIHVTNKKYSTFVASNGTNGHAATIDWVQRGKLLFDRNGSYIIC
jgi:carbonic anhydrase/acetyltransferase-like protein (isoleucine patch superfamily)